jgi:hypothetical protein
MEFSLDVDAGAGGKLVGAMGVSGLGWGDGFGGGVHGWILDARFWILDAGCGKSSRCSVRRRKDEEEKE